MEGYSSPRSSRGPQDRGENVGNENVTIVRPGALPRYSSNQAASLGIMRGYYIYPKNGEMVFFYEDSDGTKRQMRHKEQVNEPMRTGNELVGTATGNVKTGINGTFIEVDWINSFIDHRLFKSDVQINNPRKGWVNSSKVEWQKEYQSPEDKNSQDELDKLNLDELGGGGGSGFDPMILGYAAVVGALLLRGNKKGKKR